MLETEQRFLGLRRMPGLGALVDAQPTRHLASAVALGRLVRETPRFVTNELRGVAGARAYTLRDGGETVLIRHGRVDTWTFDELFRMRLYAPPAPIAAALSAASEPVVIDIGANVGMFGLDALRRYPRALITGYEPDPESAALHRRLIECNAAGNRWRLVEACAGPRAGTVTFLSGQETGSRVVDERGTGTISVPMEDVLPSFAGADLVKIDIEGGEWPLLADHRFAAARVVVLEYHTPGCPEPDPPAAARRLLAGHGYTVMPVFDHPDGYGMLWAFRPEASGADAAAGR